MHHNESETALMIYRTHRKCICYMMTTTKAEIIKNFKYGGIKKQPPPKRWGLRNFVLWTIFGFSRFQLLCQCEFSEPASEQTHIFSQLQSGVLVKCLPLRTISWISQLRFCYPNLCLGIWYAFVSFGIHGNIILVLHQLLHPHLSIYVGIPQISRKKCRYILDTTQNHRRIKHEFWWNRWKMVPNHSFDSISKSKPR